MAISQGGGTLWAFWERRDDVRYEELTSVSDASTDLVHNGDMTFL